MISAIQSASTHFGVVLQPDEFRVRPRLSSTFDLIHGPPTPNCPYPSRPRAILQLRKRFPEDAGQVVPALRAHRRGSQKWRGHDVQGRSKWADELSKVWRGARRSSDGEPLAAEQGARGVSIGSLPRCSELEDEIFADLCASTQRAASSSSGAEASLPRPNLAAIASTTVAVGSIAWYYHLYGPEAHAMTPAEEG